MYWIIAIVILGWLATVVAVWLLLRHWQQQNVPQMLDSIFVKSAATVAEQNKSILSLEQERIQSDLEKQRQSIELLVKRVEQSLTEKNASFQQSEKERSASFASLKTQLEEQQKAVGTLQYSTQRLAELLDHNQLRGQWGETLIEDLLQANGMVEGVHYVRQQSIRNTTLRPDISLLLPEKTIIPVDVKFPFAELLKLQNASDKQEKNRITKDFGIAVTGHIKKVAEYIRPDEGTLDFAMLFIPSELVFSFINQELPEIVMYAMKNRVLLVSPFTLIVVVMTVRESYRNFQLNDTLRHASKALSGFLTEWQKYQVEWEKHGRLMRQLQESFETLSGSRMRQLERKASAVEKARMGSSPELSLGSVESENIEESIN